MKLPFIIISRKRFEEIIALSKASDAINSKLQKELAFEKEKAKNFQFNYERSLELIKQMKEEIKVLKKKLSYKIPRKQRS